MPIEKIKVGDKVLSYNENTKQLEYKEVAHTFIGVKKNIVKIKIRGEKLLTTTTEHPFYVRKTKKARDNLSSSDDEEGEWLTAEKLKVGQKVLRPDGKWTRITSITRETKPTLVYNLEVENNHNYFVGEIGALSHNCNIISRISEASGFVKYAKRAGKSVQKDIDSLTKQLSNGNLNPGIGTESVFGNIVEARAKNGGRVYFRVVGDTIEILAKSNKRDQQKVIDLLRKTYGQ